MTHGTIRLSLGAAAAGLALALWLAPAAPARAQGTVDDFERGKQLLAQGDAKGAAAALKTIAERRKTDGEVWYYLGLALSRANKQKDAHKAFERAVKLQPDSSAGHTGLAFALLRLNKARDAERAARRAIALDPNHADAHYALGLVLNRADKFTEAAAEAEAALRLKPDSPAAVLLYADTLMSAFTDAGLALAEKYPAAHALGEEGRKAVLARREQELEPLKARLREVADRLDALAQAKPDEAEAGRWREQAEAIRLYVRAGGENFRVFRQSEVTTKAVITFKPEPSYTEDARRNSVFGTVRLRAVLAADGRVRHIIPVKRLPDGLTNKSIEAARKIRFTPATVNGVPVSQFVVLEYNFNIY